eukprot:COSAG01_NODE_39278_length_478_cov_6.920844_2_plen_127_part_01
MSCCGFHWRDAEHPWGHRSVDPCSEWRATVGSLQESLLQQLASDEVTRPRRLAAEQRRQEQLAKRLAKRRQRKGGQVAVLPACDGRFHCGACWAATTADGCDKWTGFWSLITWSLMLALFVRSFPVS